MFGIDIGFVHPWYLALLLLLPLLWVFSFRSLAGLGRFRRLFALAFRTLVFVLVVLALAEVQMLRTSEKMTVIYLLDQSESIPLVQRQAMLEYVRQEVARHRNADRRDKAGVIVFGHDAVIEVPPFDDDIPFLNLESTLGTADRRHQSGGGSEDGRGDVSGGQRQTDRGGHRRQREHGRRPLDRQFAGGSRRRHRRGAGPAGQPRRSAGRRRWCCPPTSAAASRSRPAW